MKPDPKDQEEIVHDRLFQRPAAIIVKRLVDSPSLVPILVGPQALIRRGVGRGAWTCETAEQEGERV